MLRRQPVWMRGLRLYDARADGTRAGVAAEVSALGVECEDAVDARVHARSRFRCVSDPDRYAIYSVHDADPRDWSSTLPPSELPGEHTLIVVREFRRVPLHASALALLVLTARGGRAAPVLAALAHFVERAVSLYQPAYLLLAHSLEQPRVSTLLMGVHECAALQAASASVFSLDALLPELSALLSCEPEWYAYCPDVLAPEESGAVSPYAV